MGKRIRLSNLTQLRRELAHLYVDTKEGHIDPKLAKSLGYIGQLLLGTMQAEQSIAPKSNDTPLSALCLVLEQERRAAGVPLDDVGFRLSGRPNNASSGETPPIPSENVLQEEGGGSEAVVDCEDGASANTVECGQEEGE